MSEPRGVELLLPTVDAYRRQAQLLENMWPLITVVSRETEHS